MYHYRRVEISAPRVICWNPNVQVYHILLGPEQVISPEFPRVLTTPEFQARVGLVAIDECHVLYQWASFRLAYTALHLRMSSFFLDVLLQSQLQQKVLSGHMLAFLASTGLLEPCK